MQLVIQKNTLNQIIVTLREKQIGTGSLFLFEFVNKATNSGSYCLAYDSSSTSRYDSFTILETGSANNYNAQIFFPYYGEYYYRVYEAVTASLNPTGLNLVERGKALVTGSGNITTAYTGSTQTYGAYDPSQYH